MTASLIVSGSAVTVASTSGIRGMRNVYTSLGRVRKYLALGANDIADDDTIRDGIIAASREIDKYTKRHFYPIVKTQYYDYPGRARTLIFDDDLLEIRGLSDMNGASEVDSSVYWLKTGDDWNMTPYDRLELNSSTGSLFNYAGTGQRAIHVEGVWGYHSEYDGAWVNSEATLTQALNASQTTIYVSGSGGQNEYGYSPRMHEDQILKVENEFIHIINGATASQLRVRRGINGTTATIHASGQTVYTWQPETSVERAARQLAAFEYLVATHPVTTQVAAAPGVGGFMIEEPMTWPPQVRSRLNRLIKRRVYSF